MMHNGLSTFNIDWRVSCNEKSGRDPECLAAANELMVEHFGRQLASMPPQQAREIVS